MTDPRPKPRLSNPVHLLAFGFGTGCAPKAPGTFGTLVGVAFYVPAGLLSLPAYLLVLVAVIGFGVWVCGAAARGLGVHDHPGIVWDEIAGYLLAMTGVPYGIGWMLAGFVLFRLFDIWKPWPIHWLDRHVGGGAGIMVDDVTAGLMAGACLHAVSLAGIG